MIRRLRIAVSVFFALVAVAFAVLWVRSYWLIDDWPCLRSSDWTASALKAIRLCMSRRCHILGCSQGTWQRGDW